MSDYTPGPWEWSTSNSIKRLSTKEKDGGVMYAYRCCDGVCDLAIQQADMQLIEAVPDMVEALRAFVAAEESFREHTQFDADAADDWLCEAYNKARAALAKAGIE